MSDDTIELIRGVNPFPADVTAPPFEMILKRTECPEVAPGRVSDLPTAPRRRRQRHNDQSGVRARPGRLGGMAGVVGTLTSLAVVAVVVLIVAMHHRTAPSPTVGRANVTGVKVASAGSLSVGPAPAALLSFDDSLWVAGHGYVARLDPSNGRLQARISVSPNVVGTAQMAAGAGSIWVTYTGTTRLLRIDPRANHLIRQISLPRRPAGGGVAFIDRRVWVSQDTNGHRGDVVAVNPRTDKVDGSPILVGSGPALLASGLGSLWVQNTSSPNGTISQINPRTRRMRSLSFSGAPTIGFGSVWATPEWFSAGTGPPLRRYDPATGTIVSSIQVPRANAVAFAEHRAWVITYPRSRSSTTLRPVQGTATLVQINPDTNRPAAPPIHLHALQPRSIAIAGHNLWIATYDGPLLHYKLDR